MNDSEQMRVVYEGVIKQNPSSIEAVHYLAVWHLERHSFQQVNYFYIIIVCSHLISQHRLENILGI